MGRTVCRNSRGEWCVLRVCPFPYETVGCVRAFIPIPCITTEANYEQAVSAARRAGMLDGEEQD